MATVTLLSAGILGIDAFPIHVEVDIANGLPGWSTVGLPESAVRESKDRVIAAIHNCGYEFPFRRITLNLAPADVKKQGTAYDLPVALGLLAAAEVIDPKGLEGYILMGELSLHGRLRPIRGALAVALLAKEKGWKGVILPEENAPEAALLGGIEARSARDLPAVIEFLKGEKDLPLAQAKPAYDSENKAPPDISEVKGQNYAKRALEIAAAGFHPTMMVGPPGSGKSLLASTLPSILTELSFEESLVTSRIHALCQEKALDGGLMKRRPFRSPHHSVSEAGLIGGGSWPRPGEVSLAHHGVLFLDELPEFRRPALETLRQPLENHSVTIVRARQRLCFPARFLLVAAMNPCPCGHFNNSGNRCLCPGPIVQRYQSRISGPLLDRFDLKVEVPPLNFQELSESRPGESGATVRDRVRKAQERQIDRLRPAGLFSNSQMSGKELKRFCALNADALRLLEKAVEKWELSARAYHRILKVSRTIADLEGKEEISLIHVSEAIAYRCHGSKEAQTPQAMAL